MYKYTVEMDFFHLIEWSIKMQNKKNNNWGIWNKAKDIIIKMTIKELIVFIIELVTGG
jgi:predicted metal-dependent peptidase